MSPFGQVTVAEQTIIGHIMQQLGYEKTPAEIEAHLRANRSLPQLTDAQYRRLIGIGTQYFLASSVVRDACRGGYQNPNCARAISELTGYDFSARPEITIRVRWNVQFEHGLQVEQSAVINVAGDTTPSQIWRRIEALARTNSFAHTPQSPPPMGAIAGITAVDVVATYGYRREGAIDVGLGVNKLTAAQVRLNLQSGR